MHDSQEEKHLSKNPFIYELNYKIDNLAPLTSDDLDNYNVNDVIFRGSEKEIIYVRDNNLAEVFSEVLNISTKLFDLFEVPQEIEWIFDGEKHWIVQSQELNETGKDK